MLMNPQRIYAEFAIFFKMKIFKDYFWNHGEMCCNFISLWLMESLYYINTSSSQRTTCMYKKSKILNEATAEIISSFKFQVQTSINPSRLRHINDCVYICGKTEYMYHFFSCKSYSRARNNMFDQLFFLDLVNIDTN